MASLVLVGDVGGEAAGSVMIIHCLPRVQIVSPKWFNTYMHIVDNCPNNLSRWEEGDFLVHTTGAMRLEAICAMKTDILYPSSPMLKPFTIHAQPICTAAGRGPHDHDKGKHMDDYLAILEARSNKETF